VLASVQQHEDFARGEVFEQRIDRWPLAFLTDAARGGDGWLQQSRVGEGRQLHEPDTVWIVAEDVCREVQREPGLTCSAGSGQRDQP